MFRDISSSFLESFRLIYNSTLLGLERLYILLVKFVKFTDRPQFTVRTVNLRFELRSHTVQMANLDELFQFADGDRIAIRIAGQALG